MSTALVLLSFLCPVQAPTTAPALGDAEIVGRLKESVANLKSFQADYTVVNLFYAGPGGSFPLVRKKLSAPTEYVRSFVMKEELDTARFSYQGVDRQGVTLDIRCDGEFVFRGGAHKGSVTSVERRAWKVDSSDELQNADYTPLIRRELIDRKRSDLFERHGLVSPLLAIGRARYADYELTTDRPVGVCRMPPNMFSFLGSKFVKSGEGSQKINGVAAVPFDLECGNWVGLKPSEQVAPHSTEIDPRNFTWKKSGVRSRWWLAPEYGYMPVRIDTFASCTSLVVSQREDVQHYQQIGPKAWFPMKGSVSYFGPFGTFATRKDLLDASLKEGLDVLRKVELNVVTVSQKTFEKKDFQPGPGVSVHDK